ncbi:hypothetical protein ACFC1T_09435 [Kitasatospora sp. NPDC056076]|uniref:hypothetical protein n=1 Tax=Kitasatospora sp. NPDC056076 TaxID=3345703 RepID=UPI0035E2BC6D
MLVLDVLYGCRATAAVTGPALWAQAWDRALVLVTPIWTGQRMTIEGPILADGGEALALGLYLIAAETDTAPSQVTRSQIEDLLNRHDGTGRDITTVWDTRLQALGHDLTDTADPITTTWARLRRDCSPPLDAPDAVWDDSFARFGPAFLQGLRYTLAPRYQLAF